MSELFLTALPYLYSSVATIAMVGYLPQIYRLAKSQGSSDDLSLVTWWIWLTTWLISLSYGALIMKDWRFCMVALVNITGHLAVISLGTYNCYFRGKGKRAMPIVAGDDFK